MDKTDNKRLNRHQTLFFPPFIVELCGESRAWDSSRKKKATLPSSSLKTLGLFFSSNFRKQTDFVQKRYINIYRKVKELFAIDLSTHRMAGLGEKIWKKKEKKKKRTSFLRLETVVFLHCFNLFIPVKSTEEDVSVVLSHTDVN